MCKCFSCCPQTPSQGANILINGIQIAKYEMIPAGLVCKVFLNLHVFVFPVVF